MGYTGKVKCIRESNSIFMKEGEIYEIVDGYKGFKLSINKIFRDKRMNDR